MGGGTAVMLTMMLRAHEAFADARCIALACPACMTLELAESCKDYVTTVVNGTDIVPTFCAGGCPCGCACVCVCVCVCVSVCLFHVRKCGWSQRLCKGCEWHQRCADTLFRWVPMRVLVNVPLCFSEILSVTTSVNGTGIVPTICWFLVPFHVCVYPLWILLCFCTRL